MGEATPGWVAYIMSQADSIEASFADLQTGKTAAGRYCGAAEAIRQVAKHAVEGELNPSLWVVSTVLQSGSVTTDQLRALWHAAQGDEDELNKLLDDLKSLGEIDV